MLIQLAGIIKEDVPQSQGIGWPAYAAALLAARCYEHAGVIDGVRDERRDEHARLFETDGGGNHGTRCLGLGTPKTHAYKDVPGYTHGVILLAASPSNSSLPKNLSARDRPVLYHLTTGNAPSKR
jgi:hypothetical protein